MKTQSTQTHSLRQRSGDTAGFTLVEILVTITIIIVLALVFTMIAGKIKQSAYRAKAMSPLRQVTVACMSYSTENNGKINTVVFQGAEKISGKWVTNTFWGTLAPHIFPDLSLTNNTASATALKQAVSALFGTPDARFMKDTFQGDGAGSIADTCAYVPLGFNFNVQSGAGWHTTAQYDDPSQVLYMTYGWGFIRKKDGDKYAPLPKTKSERTSNIDWFSNKTAACVFLDGHIDILGPPIADRYYGTKPTTVVK
jgi:type II secretory pathway pseudopilin PulG